MGDLDVGGKHIIGKESVLRESQIISHDQKVSCLMINSCDG